MQNLQEKFLKSRIETKLQNEKKLLDNLKREVLLEIEMKPLCGCVEKISSTTAIILKALIEKIEKDFPKLKSLGLQFLIMERT